MINNGVSPLDIRVFEMNFRKNLEDTMPHFLERASRIGAVNLGGIDYSIMITDNEAAYSFVLGLYAATIFFASRTIEMAINNDARMREERLKTPLKWLFLNRNVLKQAQDNGLPINLLLNTEELKLNSNPIFVIRRNKVIHGDIEGYKEVTGFYQTTDFTKPYKLPVAPSEEDAYDQLTKSRKFLIQWIKSGSTSTPKNARFIEWKGMI